MTSNVACGAFGPITWSPKDSNATVEEIKEHNAVGIELCSWGK